VKSESRIFNGVALFLFLMAAVYGIWTGWGKSKVEAAGTTAIILSGLLLFMCGAYFSFVARRIEPRPEDRPDAEIHEGAGELGFFSPGSYWPFGIALSAALAGLGIVFWAPWLIAMGGVAVLASVGGLLFEYYIGGASEH
jgi:hypothetical protein